MSAWVTHVEKRGQKRKETKAKFVPFVSFLQAECSFRFLYVNFVE